MALEVRQSFPLDWHWSIDGSSQPQQDRKQSENAGLPHEQKIGVKEIWVRGSEIGEECGMNFGREFLWGGGGVKPWKKQGRKIHRKISPRPKKSQKKIAIKIRRQSA